MIIHDNCQFHPPCSIGEEDHLKFQPIRGFYGPWQPCWITDRNESNNSWLDHANEHFCHVWSHLLQWFSRRRLKCLRMPSDGNSSPDRNIHFCTLAPRLNLKISPSTSFRYVKQNLWTQSLNVVMTAMFSPKKVWWL